MAVGRPERPEVAVVGAGIAGLAAAWELIATGDVSVTLFDSAEQVGGKLRSSKVAGIQVDEGAESMLAVRPEAVRLAAAVGLRPSIVHPATAEAFVLSRGELRPLPPGLVSGVPTDLRALAASRIMSIPGLLRIPFDQLLSGTEVGADISVGRLLTERLGREVVDRLAEPLLAGVYAGNADEISLRMANPFLFRAVTRQSSLLNAARETRTGSASNVGARRGPVFAGIRGGVARLAAKTADALLAKGAMIRTGVTAERLRRTERGWQMVANDASYEFDAVVLAVPAPVAARLLRTSAPFAAIQLRSVESASVAVVTLAYRTAGLPELVGSGFLVPPVEGFRIKGVTYSSNKWEWLAREGGRRARGGTTIIRTSLGRYGDHEVLQRDDAELVELAQVELAEIAGLPIGVLDARVTRWQDSLPQYRVGHVDLIQRARDALLDAPGLALAGAAYDGVGIAACIASGATAARTVSRQLQERGPHSVDAHG
ncbi:MAG: protoporphyrinogen/coproporphyrinogen oxidase [Actinomycetota bacterium]|nr:protoporphyrinogen/coproporphyrinogen oxidase [Actinomycetota bacterium]HQZ84156.1 protoporphyrinogen oxidase [Actinomycetota bacterium]